MEHINPEQALLRLKLTPQEHSNLQKIFAKQDKDHSGTLGIDDFYSMFGTKRSPFGDALFQLAHLETDADSLNFTEFGAIIATYCTFQTDQILRFCFRVIDTDRSGKIDFVELDQLISWLHRGGGPSNVRTAVNQIQTRYDDGSRALGFDTFAEIARVYPFLIYPAYELQEKMMNAVFGRQWWVKKRAWLLDRELERRKRREEVLNEDAYLTQRGFTGRVRRPVAEEFPEGPERRRYLRQQRENDRFDVEEEEERRRRRRKARKEAKKAAAQELAEAQRRLELRRKRAQISIDPIEQSGGRAISLTYQPQPVTRPMLLPHEKS